VHEARRGLLSHLRLYPEPKCLRTGLATAGKIPHRRNGLGSGDTQAVCGFRYLASNAFPFRHTIQLIVAIFRAVCTNILHFPARVVVTSEDALHRPRGVEGREGTADDHFHADHGSLAAALRPPASEPRPTHRDLTVATDLGVPRSTARGWLGTMPTAVIGLDVVDLTEPELR
jgi:hypothetical protein